MAEELELPDCDDCDMPLDVCECFPQDDEDTEVVDKFL